jgi:hypothetical protein
VATRTKAKANPAPKAKGKPKSVFAKGGQKKPTKVSEWFGYHLSKRADKYGWARAVRGVHRKGVAQAERARARRTARKNLGPVTHPTWSQRRQQRAFERGNGGGTTACLGCGNNLSADEARTHHCASTAAEQKRIDASRQKWRARAGFGGPTANAPPAAPTVTGPIPTSATGAPVGPRAAAAAAQLATPPVDPVVQWKWDRKAWRRANMTRPARALDTLQRLDSRLAGNGAKCGACGINVHGDEWDTHDCGRIPYTHPRHQASPAPPPTPVPAPTTAPPAGNTPAATNGGRPPVALGGSNGSSSTATGGATASGASSQHAAAILQAMSAWSQDIPKTEGEMMGMLAAMNNMCVGMGDFVRQFQGHLINMGTDAEGHPIGFHPSCVAQLNGAADQLSGAGAYFTATGVAIQQYYQPLKAFLAGGTPAPNRSYFAS